MDELKPCPFCGGKAKIDGEHWEEDGDIGGDLWIICTQCYTTSASYNEYEDIEQKNHYTKMAIDSWNKRNE